MEFLLYIGLLLAVGFIVVALLPTRGSRKDSKPAGNKYDSVFRIVELQNGMYRVEQLSYWTDEWSIPSGIGPYNFDTLEEAQVRKVQLIAELAERDGYRVKRVVD